MAGHGVEALRRALRRNSPDDSERIIEAAGKADDGQQAVVRVDGCEESIVDKTALDRSTA